MIVFISHTKTEGLVVTKASPKKFLADRHYHLKPGDELNGYTFAELEALEDGRHELEDREEKKK